ncbi:hypothetical protein FOA43_002872 [Brettanomyces nanus]|uniref:Anaphase-promoting complex subunit 4 n=1 Tax=Eeniella nana TaxID=13502 RepID=A0A875RVG3_EENNA|nr:uncharacterized protein FOA43_002872 [Brettanomyces nanus]QPG75517.1 hypothetical protein FOA43_002872 [Brettanomyces nanus]
MSDFSILTSQTLPLALASAQNFQICPSMDLISFQLNSCTIWIYRLNNEKVWDISLELDDEHGEGITKLCWRPDGKFFSIVSNFGRVSLFDADTGKSIIQFNVSSGSKQQHIEACFWSNKAARIVDTSKFAHLLDVKIISSLTKLSSDQQLVNDDESIQLDDSVLDFLIIGSSGSQISLILSGLFTVDGYQLPTRSAKILSVMSNQDLTCHHILLDESGSLNMLKLDTEFVHTFAEKLPLISRTCSRLVSLLKCLIESIDSMSKDYKPFTDYTTRIIDLLKGEVDDPIYDLYDLLLTGSLSDATKTWLTDYLGDRGIKRWTKLGRQHFEGSRKTIFYEMIPALQHLLIHLTNLQGLSKWAETRQLLGLDSTKIDNAINTGSSFLKYCYKTMLTLNEEQKDFDSVMEWLEAIVQEVTTDEKPTIQIRTKDIIQFLMSVSKRSGLNQKSSGLHQLYDSLTAELDGIFDQIKQKMKSQMSSSIQTTLLTVDLETCKWETKLYGDYGLLVVSSNDKIDIIKFDTATLSSERMTLSINGDPQSLQASLTENGNLLLVLITYSTESKLALLQLGTNGIDPLVNGSATTLKEFSIPSEDGRIATYMAHNSHRKTCCILDATRKHYTVIEY